MWRLGFEPPLYLISLTHTLSLCLVLSLPLSLSLSSLYPSTPPGRMTRITNHQSPITNHQSIIKRRSRFRRCFWVPCQRGSVSPRNTRCVGVSLWCVPLVPSCVSLWCVPVACPSGVSIWCVLLVSFWCPSGVSLSCVPLVCPSDVSLWCVPLACLSGVSL